MIACRKGDYYRYLAEFKFGDEKKEAAANSMKAYEVACQFLNYFIAFTTLIFLLFIKGTVILLLDQLISSSLLCCWFLVSCEVVIEFEVIGPIVSIGVISSYFFLGDIISQLLLKKL